MKRGILLSTFLLAIILLSGSVMPLSLTMKNNYQQGETGIVKIQGDIREPITKDQINFYRGHVLVASFDYDVKKIGGDYYIWFVTPFSPNNYTLGIDGIVAYSNGIVSNTTLNENFTIEGNTSDYSIKPGAIIASDTFEVDVILNQDSSKAINVDFPESKSVLLNPGDNKISFSLESTNATEITTINIGKYAMPAYLIKNGSNNPENTSISSNNNFTISPKRIQRTESQTGLIYQIEVINFGNVTIPQILIYYNKSALNLAPDQIDDLEANKSVILNISLIANLSVNETITFQAESNIITLPFVITFQKINGTNMSNGTENNNTALFDCTLELNGKSCLPNEICTRETVNSRQGSCCLGECAISSNPGGSSSWIGWLIAIVIIAGVGYLFFRYRKVKPATNPIEKEVMEIEKRAQAQKKNENPNPGIEKNKKLNK